MAWRSGRFPGFTEQTSAGRRAFIRIEASWAMWGVSLGPSANAEESRVLLRDWVWGRTRTGAGAPMFIFVTSGHGSLLPPVPPGGHQRVGDGWALPREAAGCQFRGHQGAAGCRRREGPRTRRAEGPCSLKGPRGSHPSQRGKSPGWVTPLGRGMGSTDLCG